MKPTNSFIDDLEEDLTRDAIAVAGRRPRPDLGNSWTNAARFTDGGYLARVIRQTCESCGNVAEHTEAIFHVELAPNGARRLQALPRKGQWPLAPGLPLEIDEQSIEWCPRCLRDLGFSDERPSPRIYSLKVPAA